MEEDATVAVGDTGADVLDEIPEQPGIPNNKTRRIVDTIPDLLVEVTITILLCFCRLCMVAFILSSFEELIMTEKSRLQ